MTLKERYQNNLQNYLAGELSKVDTPSFCIDGFIKSIRLANHYFTAIGMAEGIYEKDNLRTFLTKQMLSSQSKIAFDGVQKAYAELGEITNYYSNLGFQLVLAEHRGMVANDDIDSTLKLCRLHITLSNTIAFVITAINEVAKYCNTKILTDSLKGITEAENKIKNGGDELKAEWQEIKKNITSIKHIKKYDLINDMDRIRAELTNLWRIEVFHKTVRENETIGLFSTTNQVLIDIISIIPNFFENYKEEN